MTPPPAPLGVPQPQPQPLPQTTDDEPSSMGRNKSTVSFAAMVDECGGGGDDDDLPQDEDEMLLVDATKRTRVFSVSKDRPITRIPTRNEMKTLTHKAKRPAVDIEFHDLTYAVNTTAGAYLTHKRHVGRNSCGRDRLPRFVNPSLPSDRLRSLTDVLLTAAAAR